MSTRPLWLRALLRFFPPDFQQRRGAEIEDFVEQELSVSRFPRSFAPIRIGLDLMKTALVLRVGRHGRKSDMIGARASGGTAVLSDAHQALRAILRGRILSATVVLTLGVGIGANVALFSLIEGVLLEPLPYPDADRLVQIWETNPAVSDEPLGPSPLNLVDWEERAEVFESMTSWYLTSGTYRGEFGAEEVRSAQVTADFFRVLGAQPALGRDFLREEVVGYGPVVLSHGAWQRLFDGDPGIVGRAVEISGDSYEIIGVMPPAFAFPDESVEAWTAWDLKTVYADRPETRTWRFMDALGRLAPGVSQREAEESLGRVAAGLAEEHPVENAGWSVALTTLHDEVVGDVRGTLWVAFASVAFILLVACANVANLLLARVPTLARELAVRTTLGATRARIVRRLLSESLLLAGMAALLGLLIGKGLLDMLVVLDAGRIPRLSDVRIDSAVLAFTTLAAGLTAVLFGLVPALQSLRAASVASLRSGRATDGVSQRRLREVFVAAQLAIAVVLVTGAGLFSASLEALTKVDPGFDPQEVMTFRVSLDPVSGTQQEVVSYYDGLVERLKSVPGVRTVGISQTLPLSPVANDFRRPFRPTGSELAAAEAPSVQMRIVSPGYPTAMGMHFLDGGPLPGTAEAGDPLVALVNETLARRLWPDGTAVGQSFEIEFRSGWEPYSVVGVVQDIKHYGPRADPVPEVFLSHRQVPYLAMSVAVRTESDAAAMALPLRVAVLELRPVQPAHDFVTLEELAATSIADERFLSVLLNVLAAVALLLATTGVYGVIAYAVSHRRRDIGIRLALGAQPVRVVRGVLRDALLVAGSGVAVGTALVLGGGSLVEGLLYGIEPRDAVTTVRVVALLLVVSAAAAYAPAHRAARIAPSEALQAD